MGAALTLGELFLRAYVVDGVPSSGINDPAKSDGIAAFAAIDAALSDIATFGGATVAFDTLAHLDADLTPGAGVLGIVYNDGTASNNGVYVKVGGTGTGSWTATGITLASAIGAAVTLLEAAAPWYNTSFAQVAQLRIALQNAGVFETVNTAVSGDPENPVNAWWTGGGMVTQAGTLGAGRSSARARLLRREHDHPLHRRQSHRLLGGQLLGNLDMRLKLAALAGASALALLAAAPAHATTSVLDWALNSGFGARSRSTRSTTPTPTSRSALAIPAPTSSAWSPPTWRAAPVRARAPSCAAT